MNYDDAVQAAQKWASENDVNTCVYILASGSVGWGTYVSYSLDETIHPFQLMWSSEVGPERNALRKETAELWLQRQRENA